MKIGQYVLLRLVAGLLLGLAAMTAAQAQAYPRRPIKFIVPLPPGGTLGAITRIIAGKMEDRLGAPVTIENRPGAGTTIATAEAARANPDGYTLLIGGTAGLAVNVTLFKRLLYDPAKDFEPVALILRVPFILVANPSLPVRTVSDLIALAKQKPGQLLYASAGIGTQPHLAMELLKTMTGVHMVHVPYKGAMNGIRDVLAGRVPVMFADPASALPQVKAGNVRALGVSSMTRMTAAAEIPSIAEAGFSGFEAVVWIMVVAPAHTSIEIVSKLHATFKAILARPDVRRRIIELGAIPVDSPPRGDLRKFIKSETVRWGRIVKKAGLSGSR